MTTPIGCAGGTATVTITATGGTAPLSYILNGVTNATGVFTNVAAGAGLAWSVTDASGCAPVTGTIDVASATPITASAAVTTPIGCAGGTATVTITATGGTAPLSYILNGVTNATGVFTNVAAGAGLAWSVTDASGCAPVTGTIDVASSTPITASAAVTTPIGCAGGTATVTITATGGTAPLSYILNGVTNATGVFTNVAAGAGLSWSVTDASGCAPVTGTIDVASSTPITASAAVTTPIGCAGGTATVTITATGGTAPLSYILNGVTNATGVFTNVAAGTGLAWSVTDASGCAPVTGTIDVANATPITASAAVTTPIGCAGGTATVTITAAGGTAPLSYILNGVTNATGVFTNVAAGTGLAWSVTDASGCAPVTGTIDVASSTPITASAAVTTPIGCAGGTATVTITATGGTAPLSYILNGVTNATGVFTNVAAGTGLAWSVTDASGCAPVTGTIDVASSTPITASAAVTTPIGCAGGTATVTITATGGTAPLSYILNGVTNATGVFTNVAAGAGLAWSVTDASGCAPVTGTIDVASSTPITANAVVTTPIGCAGGTATVTITATGGTAPLSYILNGVTNATGVFTNVAAGAGLAWSVTDASGCAPVTGTIDVASATPITASAAVTTPIGCAGGTATVTITATGGTAPLSYILNGVTNATGVFTNVAAGAGLAWSVTDASGCAPVTGTIDVASSTPITASAAVTTPIGCAGGTATVTITATGGTAPLSYILNGVTNATGVFTNVAAGAGLSWSVTDASGCAPVTGTIDVASSTPITASAAVTTPIGCAGGTATVTITATGGTAPLSYILNGVTNATGVFTNVAAGTGLAWSVTDASGCAPVTGTIDVANSTPITASAAVTTPIGCAGGTATVTITAAGGTAPLSYILNGVTNATGVFTNVAAGAGLAWSVTDASGCAPVTGTIDVASSTPITASAAVTTPIGCAGGTATVTITATGGTAPLSYILNGVTNATGVFTNVAAGTGLAWSVTDASGCAPVTGTIDVANSTPITASAAVTTPIGCAGGTATVTITAAGGTAPLSYILNGVTNATGVFTNVAAGTGLAWSVTDASGCAPVTGTIDVASSTPITASAAVTTPIGCAGGTATVTITATGGTAPLSYILNGVTNATGVFTNVAAGAGLAWSVTDASGCAPVTGTIDVASATPITASAAVTTPIGCAGGTATVTITATGGTAPLSYILNGVTNATGVFTNVAAGAGLAWSVTDASGCAPVTGTIDVASSTPITASAAVTTPIGCAGGTATVTITATGGTAPLSYILNGVTNATGVFTNVAAGAGLAWSVTDASGCAPVTGTIDVASSTPITASAAVTTPIGCAGGTATVTITATGGTAPLSYILNGVTNATGVFTNVAAGAGLAWSVTDASGCAPVTGTIDVVPGAPAAPTASVTTEPTCTLNTGTVTVTAPLGTGFTYSIDGTNYQPSPVFAGVAAGPVSVYVANATGCASLPTKLNVDAAPGAPAAPTASVTTEPTCALNTGTVTVTAPLGAGFSYSIDGTTYQTSPVFAGVAPGPVSVYVENAAGCASLPTALNVDAAPGAPAAPTASVTTEPTCTLNTGTVTVTAPLGTGFTYSIDGTNYQPSPVFAGVAAGPVSVYVANATGCASLPTKLNVNSAPTQTTPTFAPIGPLCQNSTAPTLPAKSLEGITGTWAPALITTAAVEQDTYKFIPDAGQCASSVDLKIQISNQITPAFDQIADVCLNSAAPVLPTMSKNGITGKWSPNAINTAVTGPVNYLFTPDAGQCGASVSMNIRVTDQITPTFDQIADVCLNSAPPALPTISNNGITGHWTPNVVNTATTTQYQFTPDPGQCGTPATMIINVTSQITPSFVNIGPLCQGSNPPQLPTTSTNGISGSWNPSTISTAAVGTITYQFTPTGNQCGTKTSMDIEVSTQITPTFDVIPDLCQTSTPPALPNKSNNNITGTWTPSTIDLTKLGKTPYTFKPDAGQCGSDVTISVNVTDQITPTFNQVATLCLNSVPPALPTKSIEGITGSWSPTLSTGTIGQTNYLFTPDAGQCGTTATMQIEVSNSITPAFDQIGPLCQNSAPPSLPSVSKNNIAGTWSPAIINTAALTTGDNYTFTPNANQCGTPVIMQIQISAQVTPTFTQIAPLCQNSTPPSLPAKSIEGISGTWSPSTINTTTAGTTTYKFTPSVGQCGSPVTMDITITGPTAIVVTTTNANCIQADGTVTLGAVTGGTPPYTYSFNGSSYSSIINYGGLVQGTYKLSVQDNTGCIYNAPDVSIGNNGGPSAAVVTSTDATCGNNDGTITIASVTGGVAPYTYQLNGTGGFFTQATFTGKAAGTYTIAVKDANGCIFNPADVQIKTVGGPALTITNPAPTCAPGTVDITNASVTTGSPTGLTYAYFSDAGGKNILTNPSAITTTGNYYIVGTTAAGCASAPTLVAVTVNTGATAVALTPTDATCGLNNGSISIGTVTGGVAPYSFDINNTGVFTTPTVFSNLKAGDYLISVKDNNGCTFTAPKVTINSSGGPTVTITNPAPVCAPGTVDITAAKPSQRVVQQV